MGDSEPFGDRVSSVLVGNSRRGETRTHSHNTLGLLDDIFSGIEGSDRYALEGKIYENYASAMQLRNREPLEEERFSSHFFEGGSYDPPMAFGGQKDGYLLGVKSNDVFVPTHFAPASLRGGYRLVKDLVHSKTPAALFITPDLVDTIKKMPGWKILPFKLKTTFRDEPIEKTLVVNNWRAVPRLASYGVGMVSRRKLSDIQYSLRDLQYGLRRFGNRISQLVRSRGANGVELQEEML